MPSRSTWHHLAIAALAFCLVPSWANAQALSIGMNLNRIVDYNPAWVFVDAMKAARPWIAVAYDTQTHQETWNSGKPLELDATGMPKGLSAWTNDSNVRIEQRAVTLVFREIGNAFPAGVYLAQWQGKGKVDFLLSATMDAPSTSPDGHHTANIRVTPSNAGIMIKIMESDPQDPIRNLRLWLPDYDGISFSPPDNYLSPFHPLFKRRLAPFSTLRFVDWTATNWTTPHRWETRTATTAFTQSGYDNGKGAAFELMIALANETKKDLWINTPPWATKDYVRNMAKLFREQTDPKRKIYVEWANELWNFAPGFATHPWLKAQLQLPENRGVNLWTIAANRIQRDMQIWSDEFAASPNRIVRVVAGQSANPWVAKELAKKVLVKNIDAIACSAYIQLTPKQREGFNSDTKAQDILAAAHANLPRIRQELAAHKRLADMCSKIAKRPIKLVAYEGGQHFDAGGKTVPYLQALYAAQSHPEIENLYTKLLNIARDEGVELLNHYAYIDRNSVHGTWGALNTQDQPLETAPQYRALLGQ